MMDRYRSFRYFTSDRSGLGPGLGLGRDLYRPSFTTDIWWFCRRYVRANHGSKVVPG